MGEEVLLVIVRRRGRYEGNGNFVIFDDNREGNRCVWEEELNKLSVLER